MKKTSILIVSIIIILVLSCEQKTNVRQNGSAETVTLASNEKKKFDFTEGEKDTFHPKSRIESKRKSKLTRFGRLKNPPAILTPDEDALTEVMTDSKYRRVNFFDFINRTIDPHEYPFDYENDIDALKRLYKTHELNTIVSAKMTELIKLSALMVYTNNFLKEGRSPSAEEKKNLAGPSAVTITKLRREDGIGGTSEYHAALFCQLSLSCGFNSRMISMHSFDEDGNFLTNDVCEVFLTAYNKWVVFDAYHNATFYLRDDIPLSALELRNLMLENRYREISPRCMIGDFSDIVSVREKLLPRYKYIYLWRMNDILSKSKGKKYLPWEALYQAHLVWEDEYAPVAGGGFDRLDKFNSENSAYPVSGVKYVTNTKSEFYWNLNNVTMHVERTDDENGRLHFDTVTPNFDYFHLYKDGQIFKPQGVFELTPILGDFLVRSVNKFGNRGPISKVSIFQ